MQICSDSSPVQPEELCIGTLCTYLSDITNICMLLESKEIGAAQDL